MIYGIYFSCTNKTKQYVSEITKYLNSEYTLIDVTSEIKDVELTKDDYLIIGAPVWGGRIPNLASTHFKNIKGNQTPCFLVASFGNRHYDDALVEMQDLFENQGFIVQGAMAGVAKHTYGSIAVDRPNRNDISEACAFVFEVYMRNKKMETTLPGKQHTENKVDKGRFYPSTKDTCIKCGLCQAQCPYHAIDDDFNVNGHLCASCFRCIENCPVKAKCMEDDSYIEFAKMFSEKLKEPKNNEYFK